MTQEQKQLLLKDLSARLPYGVKVGFNKEGDVFIPIKFDLQTKELFAEDKSKNCICIFRYDIFKPYLRPMSSMTEEEEQYVLNTWGEEDFNNGIDLMYDNYMMLGYAPDFIDWLNAHHFDYRDLIKKGLALEASKGMYKTE